MIELPKHYDYKTTESKWHKTWNEQRVYAWDSNASRENSFVVDTPPPTVSGQLHMGHIFSYTQADFVVRFQRMTGKNIFYPMGFDDNGLPTERLVEKQKKIRATQMDRAEFIQICKEVVASEEEKFRTLFNNIALSVDWSLEYQTISEQSRKISQMSFLDLIKKDQIYREAQPILWDPVDQTALAQADIEDKEHSSFMNEIIFVTDSGENLHISTTRPELLPACVSVFYHPDDKRYQHLKGQFAITPLFNVKVPIIPDEAVSIDKGTGLVMCCTFGDTMDVNWWKIHKLPLKIIINKYGKIDEGILSHLPDESHEYSSELIGLKVSDARAKILESLKKKNLLIKQDAIVHTVKCAERSGAALEIITAPQWFIRTLPHKDAILQRSKELNWYPQTMKIRLDAWTNSVAWDWCISRQRFFGVPFPVWYSKRSGEEGRAIFADLSQLPVDPLKDLPLGYSKDEVIPDMDVMDTWATSSVSPQLSSLAVSDDFAIDMERHKKLFPADLRPQAHEILRTWAFYTMLKAHLHEQTIPWKNIMISGWCLSEDKTKMSKSKGNIIDPRNLLEQYGSDVIRYWASTSRLGADTAYSEDIVKNGKKLVNKLWNATKFASIHFDKISNYGTDLKQNISSGKVNVSTDLWLISKMYKVIENATRHFYEFEFALARDVIEDFFWKDFCDNYLEIVKVRVYNENNQNLDGQESSILTLYWISQTLLKLFAPFIPHITDELYHLIYQSQESIHKQHMWPLLSHFALDMEKLVAGEVMIELIELVRKAKAERNLSVKAEISVLAFESNMKFDKEMLEDIAAVTNSNHVSAANIDKCDVFLESKNINVSIIFKT
jgi:valyl-tRNA synthetase